MLLTDGSSAQVVLALNTNAEHAGPFPQRGCLLLAELSLRHAEARKARILVVTALCCPRQTSPPPPAGRAARAGRLSGLCCKSSRAGVLIPSDPKKLPRATVLRHMRGHALFARAACLREESQASVMSALRMRVPPVLPGSRAALPAGRLSR